jgi:hypothetical protein
MEKMAADDFRILYFFKGEGRQEERWINVANRTGGEGNSSVLGDWSEFIY